MHQLSLCLDLLMLDFVGAWNMALLVGGVSPYCRVLVGTLSSSIQDQCSVVSGPIQSFIPVKSHDSSGREEPFNMPALLGALQPGDWEPGAKLPLIIIPWCLQHGSFA